MGEDQEAKIKELEQELKIKELELKLDKKEDLTVTVKENNHWFFWITALVVALLFLNYALENS
tara:strand:+ start:118 stop:306 length:189 start_codon:yes stop_codon:yes gene_type:complete